MVPFGTSFALFSFILYGLIWYPPKASVSFGELVWTASRSSSSSFKKVLESSTKRLFPLFQRFGLHISLPCFLPFRKWGALFCFSTSVVLCPKFFFQWNKSLILLLIGVGVRREKITHCYCIWFFYMFRRCVTVLFSTRFISLPTKRQITFSPRCSIGLNLGIILVLVIWLIGVVLFIICKFFVIYLLPCLSSFR